MNQAKLHWLIRKDSSSTFENISAVRKWLFVFGRSRGE